MKSLAPLLGWVLFAYCGVCCIGARGTRWDFGRYGMPKPLVASDGLHFLDGIMLDPVTLMLYREDVMEEFMFCLFAGALLILGILVWQMRKLERITCELELMKTEPLVMDNESSSEISSRFNGRK